MPPCQGITAVLLPIVTSCIFSLFYIFVSFAIMTQLQLVKTKRLIKGNFMLLTFFYITECHTALCFLNMKHKLYVIVTIIKLRIRFNRIKECKCHIISHKTSRIQNDKQYLSFQMVSKYTVCTISWDWWQLPPSPHGDAKWGRLNQLLFLASSVLDNANIADHIYFAAANIGL